MKTKKVIVEPYNPQWKVEFEKLKVYLEAAAQFPTDIDSYIEAKSPCINEIYKKIGL